MSFAQALKIDESNQNVMRDLANVQLRLKDFTGHAESRRKMMLATPQNLQSWNSYLIGTYFSGDYDLAQQVLDSIFQIIDNQEEDKKSKPYELCELHLFRAHLHEMKGEIRKAIRHIEKKSKLIVDQVRRAETLVRLYLQNN